MESDLQQINLIVLISTIGPLIAMILSFIVGITTAATQPPLTRMQYFVRILAIILINIIVSILISAILSPSERAMRQFDTDEIIPRLWAMTISSVIISTIAGYFLGRFTFQRNVDMGKSKYLPFIAIFTPAILYFLFAPSRQRTPPPLAGMSGIAPRDSANTFSSKPEHHRLREEKLNEIVDKLITLNDGDAQKYIGKLYEDVGKHNLIRVQDVLNSRSAKFALDASGGNMEDFVNNYLSADANDGSKLGVIISRGEILMRFLMGKGVNMMDAYYDRRMDRLFERAADQLGISVEAARNTLMAFIDMIAGRIPEEDTRLMLNNLTGSIEVAKAMVSEGKIDGSMEKAVRLIGETGISVPKAIEVRDFLYEELEKSPNIYGLSSRIKSHLYGVLPPFF